VESHLLDQGRYLRLRSAKQDLPTSMSQTARQSREIEHQRGVGKHQPAQIHDHVGLRSKRAHERPSATSLGRLVLVSTTAQRRWLFVEVDDAPKPTESAGLVPTRLGRLVQTNH
jgi:hypothetical protein